MKYSSAEMSRIESESSKIFSSRVRVMIWSSRVRVEIRELSSYFGSVVCKLESMPNHTKFHVLSTTFFAMKWCPTSHKMATDKLENGAQHPMKWCPIS